MYKKNILTSAAILASTLFIQTASATTILLNFDPADFSGTDGVAALAGFNTAKTFWENSFSDNVIINLDIGFASLGAGILGSTGSNQAVFFYDDVRTALLADITSADDIIAVASLDCDDQGNGQCNRAFLDTEADGTGGAVAGLDNDGSFDNSLLSLTQANAKALGFAVSSFGGAFMASDATITFSSDFSFDFDSSNGVDAGKIDFVSVAIHEIGHALGFTSGVDDYDFVYSQQPGVDLDQSPVANTLDLFRYSDVSVATGTGILDYRPGANSFFSIDSGTTNLAQFSTGRFAGDGEQASHWKDFLGIGIMDPTIGFGQLPPVTSLDLLAFDAIGWDLTVAPPVVVIPVPATFILFIFGLTGLRYSAKKATS